MREWHERVLKGLGIEKGAGGGLLFAGGAGVAGGERPVIAADASG